MTLPGARRGTGRALNERAADGVRYGMKSFALGLAMSLLIAGCAGAGPVPGQPGDPDPSAYRPTAGASAGVSSTPSLDPNQSQNPNPSPVPTSTAMPVPSPEPTLAQLVGQKLVVAMTGTAPSADLLGRIRRGEVGGVILFGANITSAGQVKALTGALHAAATEGGQPRLLVYVDQEGGSIKRIAWAPPTLSPPEMGERGSAAVARAQGAATGAALRGLGIDVDLAPVADVPVSSEAFIARQARTFSSSPEWTAILANAFAVGLRSAGVLPVMKHFPGLGLALANTDLSVDTIDAPAAGLAPGLVPYRVAIADGIPMVMLANATYTALDPNAAAGWSPAISVTLLRHELGFTGVTMTDSLDGTAQARGVATSGLAIAAAQAGTDLILTTGSEASTQGVYAALLRQAEAGQIGQATLEASYRRILALKQASLP